ncbi:MAG: type II toxin-antitoxin system RelE/ParE family toxin [Gemmatimonadetes bacterium]|jgi:hypothetical protein|nr:type II toxin-antitoxin system RelE/ParE family toxin [Gemmatimonadota bacterium]MBK9547959.1 type II toxin-antitoxin system RelE/ParE family toxin [Gemmatimonadota bacterium]MBP6571151.1 hypothetical protein [Gemmatimonadales bacterium]MBP9896941.1 hypothetical protein [Gemmatimonadales bacterium]
MRLTFVETVLFTKRVQELGLEAGLRGLQAALMANPTQGDLDPGTGGLRKVRIPDAGRGKGKRGGARVHYLYLPHSALIYLLFVYGKDELITLSAVQKKQLRRVVEAIRTEWEFRRR